MTQYFKAEVAQAQWAIISYLDAQTRQLIFSGRLSKHSGRIRLFLRPVKRIPQSFQNHTEDN